MQTKEKKTERILWNAFPNINFLSNNKTTGESQLSMKKMKIALKQINFTPLYSDRNLYLLISTGKSSIIPIYLYQSHRMASWDTQYWLWGNFQSFSIQSKI